MAGLYVHIPFCKSRCIYCDFYSTVGRDEKMGQYVEAVLAEARLRCHELCSPVSTIYFGGGTPSILSSAQLSNLVAGLQQTFDFSQVEEFTVEVNPDDVTPEKIALMRRWGVNRISMGIQSFDDGELRILNRRHTARQAIDALAAIRAAGIGNISIDLIYGIPGQTLATWLQNVEQAIGLDVQHISAYSLMYEHGTRLWFMLEQAKIKEVDEETSVAMYQALAQQLKAAHFEHYEVSNFAQEGYFSRHNSSYWNLVPYLGLGAGAHSYNGLTRRSNPANLKKYLKQIAAGPCAFEEERVANWERYDEYVMLRMRTAQGLSIHELTERFEEKFVHHFLKNAEQEQLLQNDGTRFFIPEQHVMLTDAITRNLMW